MAEYLVKFNGSTGSVHEAIFGWDESGFQFLKCGCPAGQCSQLCKHVKAFFATDMSMLNDWSQRETFQLLCEILKRSPFAEAYRTLQANLRDMPYVLDSGTSSSEKLKVDFTKTLAGK